MSCTVTTTVERVYVMKYIPIGKHCPASNLIWAVHTSLLSDATKKCDLSLTSMGYCVPATNFHPRDCDILVHDNIDVGGSTTNLNIIYLDDFQRLITQYFRW